MNFSIIILMLCFHIQPDHLLREQKLSAVKRTKVLEVRLLSSSLGVL